MKFSLAACGLVILASASFARPVEFRLDVPDALSRDYSANVTIALEFKNGHQQAWTLFDRDELASGMKTKTVELAAGEIKSCAFSWTIMNHPPRSPKQPEAAPPELLVPTTLNQAVQGACPTDQGTGLVKLTPAPYFLADLEVIVEKGALARRNASDLLEVNVLPQTELDAYPSFHFGNVNSESQLPLRNFSRILLRATPVYEVQSVWYVKGDFSDELLRSSQSPIVIR